MTALADERATLAGCQVRLLRGGDGPPLLYLHDAGGARRWPALEALSERFHVIAPEYPGYGGTAMPDWLDTMDDLAYHHLDILEELDLTDVHLVGVSTGGWLAAEIAIRNTSRLRSLTLAGAIGLHVDGVEGMDNFLCSRDERIRSFFADPDKAEAALSAMNTDPEAEDLEISNRYVAARLTWQPRSHNPHLGKWLHRIDIPTLLIWGDSDRLVPLPVGEAYRAGIPNARLAVLERCGHLPHVEQAAGFVAAIDDFVGGLER